MKRGQKSLKSGLSGFLVFGILFFAGLQTAVAAPYGRGLYGRCTYDNCSISVATTGEVNLEITPATNGSVTISRDEVTVFTSSSKGYSLSLESDSETNNDLSSDSGSIPAVSGTVASPVQLDQNGWGFRVDGLSGFGPGPTVEVTDAHSSSLSFAGLPLKDNGSIVRSSAAPPSGPEGEVTEVWYGAFADMSVEQGNYSRSIIYTAVTIP